MLQITELYAPISVIPANAGNHRYASMDSRVRGNDGGGRWGVRSGLGLLLALAACDVPPRPPVPGQEARKAVDAATLAYGNCIDTGAKTVVLAGRPPGNVVAEIVQSCKKQRGDLAAKIAVLQKLGHPKQSDDYIAAVADASIKALEPQIRSDAVVTLVSRDIDARNAK